MNFMYEAIIKHFIKSQIKLYIFLLIIFMASSIFIAIENYLEGTK